MHREPVCYYGNLTPTWNPPLVLSASLCTFKNGTCQPLPLHLQHIASCLLLSCSKYRSVVGLQFWEAGTTSKDPHFRCLCLVLEHCLMVASPCSSLAGCNLFFLIVGICLGFRSIPSIHDSFVVMAGRDNHRFSIFGQLNSLCKYFFLLIF